MGGEIDGKSIERLGSFPATDFSWQCKLAQIIMIETIRAAISKYYRLGGLNNRNLFLTVLEAERSRFW